MAYYCSVVNQENSNDGKEIPSDESNDDADDSDVDTDDEFYTSMKPSPLTSVELKKRGVVLVNASKSCDASLQEETEQHKKRRKKDRKNRKRSNASMGNSGPEKQYSNLANSTEGNSFKSECFVIDDWNALDINGNDGPTGPSEMLKLGDFMVTHKGKVIIRDNSDANESGTNLQMRLNSPWNKPLRPEERNPAFKNSANMSIERQQCGSSTSSSEMMNTSFSMCSTNSLPLMYLDDDDDDNEDNAIASPGSLKLADFITETKSPISMMPKKSRKNRRVQKSVASPIDENVTKSPMKHKAEHPLLSPASDTSFQELSATPKESFYKESLNANRKASISLADANDDAKYEVDPMLLPAPEPFGDHFFPMGTPSEIIRPSFYAMDYFEDDFVDYIFNYSTNEEMMKLIHNYVFPLDIAYVERTKTISTIIQPFIHKSDCNKSNLKPVKPTDIAFNNIQFTSQHTISTTDTKKYGPITNKPKETGKTHKYIRRAVFSGHQNAELDLNKLENESIKTDEKQYVDKIRILSECDSYKEAKNIKKQKEISTLLEDYKTYYYNYYVGKNLRHFFQFREWYLNGSLRITKPDVCNAVEFALIDNDLNDKNKNEAESLERNVKTISEAQDLLDIHPVQGTKCDNIQECRGISCAQLMDVPILVANKNSPKTDIYPHEHQHNEDNSLIAEKDELLNAAKEFLSNICIIYFLTQTWHFLLIFMSIFFVIFRESNDRIEKSPNNIARGKKSQTFDLDDFKKGMWKILNTFLAYIFMQMWPFIMKVAVIFLLRNLIIAIQTRLLSENRIK